jgi:hypothetical protein
LVPDYSSDHYHSIPYGAKNGVKKGMKLIIDVESFDYAYYPRGSRDHIHTASFSFQLMNRPISMLHCISLESLAGDKNSSLSSPFVSYEEYKVLQMKLQRPYSQHFIFFVTYE